MGLLERIKEIQEEMARTQKNKATEHHFGMMKARLSQLQRQLIEGNKAGVCSSLCFLVSRLGSLSFSLFSPSLAAPR